MPDQPSLDQWKEILAKRMEVLDEIWEQHLDELWAFAPSDMMEELGDTADNFHQFYWDVFDAAVQTETLDELTHQTEDAVNKAQERVASAWRAVASGRINRIQIPSPAVSAPLSEVRKTIRAAKEALRKGDKLLSPGENYRGAMGHFKNAIILAFDCEDKIDDAVRANDVSRSTLSISKRRMWISAAAIIVSIILFFVGWWANDRWGQSNDKNSTPTSDVPKMQKSDQGNRARN